MSRVLVKSTLNGKGNFITCPADKVEGIEKVIMEMNEEIIVESFTSGTMPLEAFPEDVQEKVKSILKAFNEVSVDYEHGRFNVSASYCVKKNYHYDHFVCGRYLQTDIYTEEERRQNFIEEFGYVPCYL